MAADTADDTGFHETSNYRAHAIKAPSNGQVPAAMINNKEDVAYSGWLTHSPPDIKRGSRKRR